MPFRYARAGARSGPSVSARLRCLRSKLIGTGTVSVGLLALREVVSAGRVDSCALRCVAHPGPFPLRKPPEVARDLGGIELAPGQMHVRGRDQPALVTGERH